jgi:membrane protein YqaA with SNARE-associated domain
MRNFAAKLTLMLAAYGGWGIIATSFLDSTFVPMPGFNDLFLLHLSSRRPSLALVYAVQCTLGSLLGCFVVYGLGRGGGDLMWRRARARLCGAGRRSAQERAPLAPAVESEEGGTKVRTAQRWLERNDFAFILVLSLLPPPAPFKVLVATAGALRVNPVRFGLALLLGRGLRFSAEGLLGARYGAQAESYVRHHIGWVSLLCAIVVILGTVLYGQLRKTSRGQP